MTVLSAVVAAIGLRHNSVTIIIGAMVIAPLLGPNMAMALGTALGDLSLLRRASLTAGDLVGERSCRESHTHRHRTVGGTVGGIDGPDPAFTKGLNKVRERP